jgi:hypothetical protein
MNAIVSLSPSVQSIIDEYGSIDSEIKRLTKQKEALSAQIKAAGAGKYAASIYEALVFPVAGRESIDWESVAVRFCELKDIEFKPSAQLLSAYTKKSADSLSLKVSKV